ncbi:MAG: hypothetical protein ACUVR8_05445 [Acidobacteriota bacterium]
MEHSMVGEHTSLAQRIAEDIARLETRTRQGTLPWQTVVAAPVVRCVADDAGIRYALTGGRDGLPAVLTAFDPARQLVHWKISGTPNTQPRLWSLVSLVLAQFGPAKTAIVPDMTRIVVFPSRPAARAWTLAERTA